MNTSIQNQLKGLADFSSYLEQNNYSKTTIDHYAKRVAAFLKWTKRRKTTASEIDYKTCMKYLKYLGQKQIKPITINTNIVALRKYFAYLIGIQKRMDNPLEDVTIKGVVRRGLHNILEVEELEDLYYSFSTQIYGKYARASWVETAKRNKIIIGLIVYQGLGTTDLKSLRIEDIWLSKGKVYVPANRRSNAREIALKPWQIMDFIEYLDKIRPQIALRNKLNNEKLLIPQKHLGDLLGKEIIQKLRRTNQKVIGINQLRASVICHWLKKYNVRKVQYLVGHRHISSTETYQQNNLESLQEAINQFHPLSE